MISLSSRRGSRWRSAAAVVAGVATAGLLGPAVLAAPAAMAESTTSPTGMVAVSVTAPVTAGVATAYTMTVTNTTAEAFTGAGGIIASGTMPSGVTVQHITGCTNIFGGNQSTSFLCSMPNLAAGASETATFSLTAATAGSYQIPFGASASEPEPGSPGVSQIVSDSTTLGVTVQAGPTDVQVTGSASNGSPPVGSTFTYTFQVKDNGPLAAAGVTFDDALPAAIHVGSTLSASIGSCTANPAANSVHCAIGNPATGQQSTITFSAAAATTGTLANTGTVSMSGTDTHPANNSATVTVQPR